MSSPGPAPLVGVCGFVGSQQRRCQNNRCTPSGCTAQDQRHAQNHPRQLPSRPSLRADRRAERGYYDNLTASLPAKK